MFGSQILDTALGIAFVLMVVSLICSAIREALEGWLKTRAAHLEHGVRELLHDRNSVGIAKALFEHPLISGLYAGEAAARPNSRIPMMIRSGGNLPSYIPSRSFALAIMDIAARGPITDELSGHPDLGELSLENVRAGVLNIGNPAVQRVLLTAIDSARGDFGQAVANVEKWYDASMDRVSGWYKRSTQWILFAIGLALAGIGNINTITIADQLFHDTALRTAIVTRAERASQAGAPPATADLADLEDMKLPIGWEDRDSIADSFIVLILGWLVTAFAATLGAPFWFDVLNKIMVIRSTVKPHEKSPEEASEDRQMPAASRSPGDQATSVGPAPAGAAAAASSPPSSPRPANVLDANSRIDGCDTAFTDEDATADEDLPPAEGGVV